ncbi:unnamed protein product [Candida verbasci]|uniref:Phosphatidylinositol N-acetylglucosaminyltransferase n=1 Tax=Candida verbasci TaxID=1227364 RepID=A0A9W4TSK4_9ASCO|nr:unnamed protein product [Candida verbasci]
MGSPKFNIGKQLLSPSPPSSPIRQNIKPWKKLLYLQQSYPDNYTDKSFLSQLKRNTTVAKYSYLKLIDDFSLIVFYITNILLVILMFIGIYVHEWDPTLSIIITSLISTIILFIFQTSINLKSFILITFILLICSPILKSLTKSTSSDSIWAISFILSISNTIFHEYTNEKNDYKPITSTNISLSNAIVLASRLNSTLQVFLFILYSIQVNILLPLFDYKLRVSQYKKLHYILFSVLITITSYLIYNLLNYMFLIYWLISIVTILLIIPYYFLSLQRYKNELQGPWDIAKPKLLSKEM